MMKKVYYTEPYLKTLVCKPEEATIFYPECGGQPGDIGWADNIKIIDTQKAEDGSSVYVTENNETLDAGREYEFKLDWEHRYRYMKLHTCQHMLSGLLFTKFNIGTVAVHLGEEYFTIEIAQDKIDRETIESLIDYANKAIIEGHRIIYHEKTHQQAEQMGLRRSIKVEGDVRLVEIEGIDIIACGGVHVANTSEIGLVMYYKQEQIRGHVRLFFKCAQDAVEYAVCGRKIVNEAVSVLGCSDVELSARSQALVTQINDLKHKVSELGEKAARAEILENLKDDTAVFESSTDPQFFCNAVNDLDNILLCAVSRGNWIIVTKGRFESIDFNKIRENVLAPSGAKGGGKVPVFRGSVPPENSGLFIESFKNQLNIL